jgi:hypothetical protein
MQKIQSYLYSNRIQLLANLAGSIPTEYTNVYQRNVKVYKGVDNVLEFDIKNADQKRIDLTTVTNLQMNLMDESGIGLPSSPYTITKNSPVTGITSVKIPAADLADINSQSLKYSVTGTVNDNNIVLYADSRFGALGTIEVMGSAVPVSKAQTIYDRFSGEINFAGNVIYHSSAYATKFYEAVPTTTVIFVIHYTNFAGELYIEGTEDSTISVQSFTHSPKLHDMTINRSTGSTTITVDIGSYNYLRVSWFYPDVWQYSATGQDPTTVYGSIDKITVTP